VDSALGTFHFDKQPEILCTLQLWTSHYYLHGRRST